MGEGFTKLFGTDLLQSSVWQEEKHVRLVWVTMMSLTNERGVVAASVPGLAHAARVTLSECEEALGKFLAPDKYSRTPDNEGRRIEAVVGGWRLLNHGKYRAKLDAADQREKAKQRMRNLRAERDPNKANDREQDANNPNAAEQDGLSLHSVRDVRDHRSQITDPLSDQASPLSPELPDPRVITCAQPEDTGPAFTPADEPPPGLEIELTDSWEPAAEPDLDADLVRLNVDRAHELAKLRDRARARGKTSSDWQATWREWLRRAIDYAKRPKSTALRADPVRVDHIARVRAVNERENAERAEADARAAADRDVVRQLAADALKPKSPTQTDEKAPE